MIQSYHVFYVIDIGCNNFKYLAAKCNMQSITLKCNIIKVSVCIFIYVFISQCDKVTNIQRYSYILPAYIDITLKQL